MNPEEPLPDLFKLPPMDFQEFDAWKKDSNDDAVYLSEPEPDYSDSEDEASVNDLDPAYTSAVNDLDPAYTSAVWRARKDKLDLFTKDKYEQMLASAGNITTVEIPEPDYLEPEDGGDSPDAGESPLSSSPSYSSSILASAPPAETNSSPVEPRKLVNPCVESRARQELHRELLLNQKLGKDVLHQKSELMKELERRKDAGRRREMEEYHRSKRTSLEVKLEEQASKLNVRDPGPIEKKPIVEEKEAPEFLKVFSKIHGTKVDS